MQWLADRTNNWLVLIVLIGNHRKLAIAFLEVSIQQNTQVCAVAVVLDTVSDTYTLTHSLTHTLSLTHSLSVIFVLLCIAVEVVKYYESQKNIDVLARAFADSERTDIEGTWQTTHFCCCIAHGNRLNCFGLAQRAMSNQYRQSMAFGRICRRGVDMIAYDCATTNTIHSWWLLQL
jgi:hypothetical protein